MILEAFDSHRHQIYFIFFFFFVQYVLIAVFKYKPPIVLTQMFWVYLFFW